MYANVSMSLLPPKRKLALKSPVGTSSGITRVYWSGQPGPQRLGGKFDPFAKVFPTTGYKVTSPLQCDSELAKLAFSQARRLSGSYDRLRATDPYTRNPNKGFVTRGIHLYGKLLKMPQGPSRFRVKVGL